MASAALSTAPTSSSQCSTPHLLSPSVERRNSLLDGGGEDNITKSPSFVEQQYVHDVYEEIAEHCFTKPEPREIELETSLSAAAQQHHDSSSSTAASPTKENSLGNADSIKSKKSNVNRRWPNVVNFLESLDDHSLVCDVGCGDGKYMATEAAIAGRISIISVDLCGNLLRSAQMYASRTPSCDVVAGNNLKMSFRDGAFDAVVSVGVLHHFSTEERRLKALGELGRLLNPNGGRLLIYVWALEQPRRNFSCQDILVPSDVDISPRQRRQKLKKTNSNSGSADQPALDKKETFWPVKNGHRFVFEEFPEWPCSPNRNLSLNDALQLGGISGSVDNIVKRLGSSNSNENDAKSSEQICNENSRKNSIICAGSTDLMDPGTACEGQKPPPSPSFFSRILPPFFRPRKSDTPPAPENPPETKPVEEIASTASTPVKQPKQQRSLYRYYHVFAKGELESLVDRLNRQCHDAELYRKHLHLIDVDNDDDELSRKFVEFANNASPKHSSSEDNNQNSPKFCKTSDKPKMHLKVVKSFYDHANWAVEIQRIY